jgi:hypothetical protein
MPAGIDDTSLAPSGVSPDYQSLFSDQQLTVAALFGRIGDGEPSLDHGQWSYEQFTNALIDMGLERGQEDSQGWTRYSGSLDVGLRIRVDVLGPKALPRRDGAKRVGAALREALASHEVVYLNGHSFGGSIDALGHSETFLSNRYGILMLDTCWSTQHYGLAALEASALVPQLDIIVNDRESVTGSVDGFQDLLSGLSRGAKKSARSQRPEAWSVLLSRLNRGADTRAAHRRQIAPENDYPMPERYRLAQAR